MSIVNVFLFFNRIFYKLTYIDGGYYLTKRLLAWIPLTVILLPICILYATYLAIKKYFKALDEYQAHKINAEQHKLTKDEKKYFRLRLMK